MGAHTLHIANGTSTTTLIERAGIPGDCSIWADALHDGPVPGGLSNEELREVRAKYFAHLLGEDWRGWYDEVTRWDDAVQRVAEYDEVVLWFEHDLFDQLNLIQLLDRLDTVRRHAPARISLVCIDRFPGRLRFRGLGELTPSELATLPALRQPVTDGQFNLAGRSWRAFTDADPRAVEALLEADTSDLPFLANAFHRYLDEFPDSVTGLSRTENRVLEIGWAMTPLERAFAAMHEGENAFFIGDLSFLGVVRELAATDPPLLQLFNLPADVLDLPLAMASTRFQTTNVGRAVVEGRQDRVPTTGIDTWRGGVHLAGRDTVWRWDRATGRLARR